MLSNIRVSAQMESVGRRDEFKPKCEVMNKTIAILTLTTLIGCSESMDVPLQAKAWCQYNDFENQENRDNYNQWSAQNPHKNTIPQKDIERMADELRPKLKAERDRLFGPMSIDDFGMVTLKSIREDWYQKYCNHQ